jgi:hypothetical protein
MSAAIGLYVPHLISTLLFSWVGCKGWIMFSSKKTNEAMICFCSTGVWTQDLYPEPLYQPYLCDGVFFQIVSLKLFVWAGFEPQSSLISASWVARITGVSHQHPAWNNVCCNKKCRLQCEIFSESSILMEFTIRSKSGGKYNLKC